MPSLLAFCPLLLAAALAAQQEPALTLPRLRQLGPLPQSAKVVQIGADAMVRDAAGLPLDLAELVLAVAETSAPVLLRIDRLAPSAVVVPVLDVCRDWGVAAVQFAAVLPDGRVGAFTLALPAAIDAPTVLDMRMHRQRRGVPPTSAQPFLRRMQQGWTEAKQPPLVLGVEVPGDAPFEQLLQALAVVADAGIDCAVVRPVSPIGVTAPRTVAERAALAAATHAAAQELLAIDLAPAPFVRVPAPAGPAPESVPVLKDSAVGCNGRAAARSPERIDHGDYVLPQSIVSCKSWLARTQQLDGSWADTLGEGDPEATALALLGLVGNGTTLTNRSPTECVCRATGWLLSQQHGNGSFTDEGAMRRHAMATWALTELCGPLASAAEPRGALLRAFVQPAVDWLEGQRLTDGGWNDGRPGAPADTLSTAWCLLALQSANALGFQLQAPLAAQAAWLDKVTDAGGMARMHVMPVAGDDDWRMRSTAAALCARLFVFQAEATMKVAGPAAEWLSANVDLEDPLASFLTGISLYQVGGKPFLDLTKRWSARVSDRRQPQQIDKGANAGSWSPPQGMTRTAATALRVLSLEAYYRYSRLVR